MKLFSADITTAGESDVAKAVILRKTRNGYHILKHYITEPENLKALSGDLPLNLSTDYFETVIGSVYLPVVKDPKTFMMLAQNKLKDQLEPGVDYLMAYRPDESTPADSFGNSSYKIYMIPASVYNRTAVIPEQDRQRTNMFTLSGFAICGISAGCFRDETVIHAFADSRKILVTVSRNETVLYTRDMEYQTGEPEQIDNIFYESLHLTYLFVVNNAQVDVERVVLSGLLAEREGLSAMLFAFEKVPQSVIIPSKLISGCGREELHRFMLPISLCMLEDDYDFTPIKYRESRAYNFLKSCAGIILLLIAFAIAYLDIITYADLDRIKDRYFQEVTLLKAYAEQYAESFRDVEDEKYSLYYLSQIQKYKSGAFDIYKDTAELIDTGDYAHVVFSTDEQNRPAVMLLGTVSYSGLKDIDRHQHLIKEEINKLDASGIYKVSNGSRYNMEKQTGDIRLLVEHAK
ncbi:hypothetical protein ACMC5R_05980 [Deferribacteres bacterium DY0037]